MTNLRLPRTYGPVDLDRPGQGDVPPLEERTYWDDGESAARQGRLRPKPTPEDPRWLLSAREYVGLMARCSQASPEPCSEAVPVQQAILHAPRPSSEDLRRRLPGEDRAAALVAAWVLRVGDDAFFRAVLELYATESDPVARRVLDLGINTAPDRRLAERIYAPHFSIGFF